MLWCLTFIPPLPPPLAPTPAPPSPPIREYQSCVMVTVAGMSNALSGVVACNSILPVIACPPLKDDVNMLVNIHSSLQCPSKVPVMTVLSPSNTAECVLRILSLN